MYREKHLKLYDSLIKDRINALSVNSINVEYQ